MNDGQQVNLQLTVVDMVEFVRWNEHAKPPRNEDFVAVWLRDVSGNWFVCFQRTDRNFASSLTVGDTALVGFTVKRTDEPMDHANPPKGLDRLPQRTVIIRPQIGGYKSLAAAAAKEAKKAARMAKLRGE